MPGGAGGVWDVGAAAAGHAGVEGEAGRCGGARVAAPAVGGDVFEALGVL